MRYIIAFLVILSLASECRAQYTLPMTKQGNWKVFERIEKLQYDYIDSLYVSETHIEKQFVNGTDYIRYYFNSHTNPTLRVNDPHTGVIFFDDRRYPVNELQYDTFKGQLVYSDGALIFKNRMRQIALNSDHIWGFDLCFRFDTLKFRYFSQEIDPGFNLSKGYYETVYSNKCSFIIRHISTSSIINGIEEYYYNPVRYVSLGNGYTRITSRKQFVNLFGDKHADIKRFMKKNDIFLKRAPKNQLTEVLRFYESL